METKEQAIRNVFFQIKRMRETARQEKRIEREVALGDALYTFRNMGLMEEADIVSGDYEDKKNERRKDMEHELQQTVEAATHQIKQDLWDDKMEEWKINHYNHVATRLIGLGNQRGYLLFHAFLDPLNLRWDLTANTPVFYTTKREALRKAAEWRDED